MKKQEFNAKGMACPLPVVETKKLLVENDVVETIVDNFIATQNLEKLANQLNYNYEVIEVEENKEYKVTISKKEINSEVIVNSNNDKCFVPLVRVKRKLEEQNAVEIIVNSEDDVRKLRDYAEENNYKFIEEEVENGYKLKIEKTINENKIVYSQEKDESYIVVVNKKIMGHGSEELGGKLIKGFLYALTEQEILPKKIIFYNDGATLVDKNKSHVLNELEELEERGVEILTCGACIDYHKIDLAVGNPTNMYFIVEDMRKANRIIRP